MGILPMSSTGVPPVIRKAILAMRVGVLIAESPHG
jgi:hypothetical protein